jgi:hypothetical protein
MSHPMNNPVTEGLAVGLKPSALAAVMRKGAKLGRQDTISVHEAAAINIAAKIGRLEALQERAVEAAERQANALEVLAGLFASCVGVGSARCYVEGAQGSREVPLNYLRSGNGAMPFACDADKAGDDDGE